jgi:galactokinase
MKGLDIDGLRRNFADFSGGEGNIYFAPGRVNLIGEHVDYSGGFVLPASLSLGVAVAIAPRPDATLRLRSEDLNETVEFPLAVAPRQGDVHWSDYVKGVIWALAAKGCALRGADMLVRGNVPLGAGLSSSAALEVASAFALLDIAAQSLGPMDLALACQAAENSFVGAQCGIMDQFAATHGQPGCALFLDCEDLHWRALPLAKSHGWVIADSLVRHSHASGAYNTRRNDSMVLAQIVRERRPDVHSLRELTAADVEGLSPDLPRPLAARLRHIVGENRRVLAAVSALGRGDMGVLGELLTASHASLRDDYAVSCRELDLLVDMALDLPGVAGARMVGGGFGGCTLSLVEKTQVGPFVENLRERYARETKVEPWLHLCEFGGAVRRIA